MSTIRPGRLWHRPSDGGYLMERIGPAFKGLHPQVPRHAAYPAPTLQKEIWDKCLALLAAEPDHLITERGHGRINRWSTWMATAAGIDFPYAAQIGWIRRDVFDLDGVAISKEITLAITSSPPAEPARPICTPT